MLFKDLKLFSSFFTCYLVFWVLTDVIHTRCLRSKQVVSVCRLRGIEDITPKERQTLFLTPVSLMTIVKVIYSF